MNSLEVCEYHSHTFKEVLDQVQRLVDDLNLRSYSNLPAWVADLDNMVSMFVECVCEGGLLRVSVPCVYSMCTCIYWKLLNSELE